MIALTAQRLAQAGLVLLTIAALAFVMAQLLGDPLVSVLGADSTAAQRDAMRAQLGLDRPLPQQFGAYVARLASGDLGISYRLGRPVAAVLRERLPATMELAGTAMVLALAAGIPAGIAAAVRRRGLTARALMAASLLGISMPSFFLGVMLIWIFTVTLGWLPSFGRGEVRTLGWWSTGLLTPSGRASLVLPALTLAAFQVAMLLRLVRAEMLEVLRTDFIRFAKARGLRWRAIHLGHALRNAAMPVITITGLQLGSLIAFDAITESVFQWPGLGLLFLQSVGAADVPVMSAFLVLIGCVFVLINLGVDLLYLVVDPRLRHG